MSDMEILRKVKAILTPVLPAAVPISKVIVYVEVDDSSYMVLYHLWVDGEAAPVQCYDAIEKYDLSERDTAAAFDSIAYYLRNKREPAWSNVTIQFGKAVKSETVLFDNTDLTENEYEYYKSWKKKYLE